MIELIVGKKGSGKTKRILEMVNKEAVESKGDVVFIDDDKRYMYDVKHEVRFVNVKEYGVDCEKKLYGFLCGMLAQNFDISAIYVDAFLHVVKKSPAELEQFFRDLVKQSEEHGVKFVFNVSADISELPEYMREFVI